MRVKLRAMLKCLKAGACGQIFDPPQVADEMASNKQADVRCSLLNIVFSGIFNTFCKISLQRGKYPSKLDLT